MKSRILSFFALVVVLLVMAACAMPPCECVCEQPAGAPAVTTGEFEGPVSVDGKANVVQFTVQGHSTQTSDIFVVENSAGTDLLTVDTSGVGAATFSDDITLTDDTTGGNAGAVTQFVGLPRLALVDGTTGTNPGGQTVSCIDTDPTGEWAEVDGGTNITVTADTTYYRVRTNSIKIAFAAGVENEGVDGTITEVDMTDMESLSFWIYSDVAIASGDFDVTLDDTNGTDQVYSVGAVSANVWTYVELDINACDSNCDTVDGIHFLLTAQGAANTDLDTASVYLDEMWFWDATDEEALGHDIVDWGVLYVLGNETAGGGMDMLVEGTDYFIHYESGNDFIVYVTDQSSRDVVAFVAY